MTIDYVNPEAPWPGLAELRDRSREKGFELHPRLPVYPEYFVEDFTENNGGTNGYLPAALKQKVAALADVKGYVKGGIQRYVGTD